MRKRPALEIAREVIGDAAEVRRLTLPDDRWPEADAIVAVGHPMNFLPDLGAFDRALIAIAQAARSGGVVAFDVCDLEWARARKDAGALTRAEPDSAMMTTFSIPSPDRFIRDITTFLPNQDGSWRRDSQHHKNVLVDGAHIPPLLSEHGIDARINASFGAETLPDGLLAIIGQRPSYGPPNR